MMFMVIMVLRMETLFCMETKDRAIMVEVMVEDMRSIAVMRLGGYSHGSYGGQAYPSYSGPVGEVDMVMVEEVNMIS